MPRERVLELGMRHARREMGARVRRIEDIIMVFEMKQWINFFQESNREYLEKKYARGRTMMKKAG